ncbi:hypothetical protein ACLKA7_014976 [Drosophila subpalustris]
MFYWPALSLFLYNLLLVYFVRRVKRISHDSLQVTNDSGSLWDYVPIVGEYITGKDLPVDQTGEHNEFSKILLTLNIMINTLILMPFFIKNIRLTFLLGVVITWNVFILQRVFAFQIMLVWSLWFSRISRLYYATIIGVLVTTDLVHLKLILRAIKLQRSCLQFTVQREWDGADVVVREAVPESIEGPIGDVST